MYGEANNRRLALLKLDGFRPGAVVLFCPVCDFQCEYGSFTCCPHHDTAPHITLVTPDLLAQTRRAA